MDETGTQFVPATRTWLKRVGLACGILVLLLVVFHRPLLLGLGRRVAIHFAAKENLKLDCRLEGSIFGNLVIRNLHAVSTGPSVVESLDADYIRADYSLLDLWRTGMSELVKNVEVRNVRAVLDPAKAPVTPKPPKPDQPIRLPAIFPDRIHISDVSVLARAASAAQDFVVEHFDLELNPNAPGELRIAKLQLPSVPARTGIVAQTSYPNKNLILRGLALDDQNQIRVLGIDASHIKEKRLDVTLEGTIAGGTTSGSVALSETQKSLDMNARFVLANISLESLGLFLGQTEGALSGTVNRVEIAWSGAIDAPRSWNGTIAAEVANMKKGDFVLDRISLNLAAQNSIANIIAAEVTRGPNKLSLTGNVTLPADIREFGRAPASLQISGQLLDLKALVPTIAGSATINGRADIADATLRAALKVSAGSLSWSGGSAESATALITASKKMPPPNLQKVYYSDLETETHLDASNVQANGFAIDALNAVVKSADDLVTLDGVKVTRALNAIALRGTYRLPNDFSKARMQPADVQISINAPQLADYSLGNAPLQVTGPLQADGQITLRDGLADGELSLYGSNLRAQNLTIPELSSRITIWHNTVYLNDLTANLNEHDFVRATGTFSTDAPHRYSGALAVNIANLATLKPIVHQDLAGALALDWHGDGQVNGFQNSGALRLRLEHGRFAKMDKLEANIDANYSPNELNVPIIYAASDKLMVQAVLQAKGDTLEMTKIQLDQGQAKYAGGYVSVPFTWANLGSDRPIVPANGKVLVNFQSENLDLQKLAKDFGATAPVAGSANMKIDAQGTLQDLHAAVDLQLTGLRSENLKDFTPAAFGLSARVENNKLTVDGKLQQARIEPVQITASMPLNAARLAEEKKLDENTPIAARVQMPRSSINFVRQFVPAIERIDGNLALDVNVGGTIAKPVLSGAADATINVARLSNASVPPLTNFNARLAFNGDTLSFQQFSGELSGGKFTVSGAITFPKLTTPDFNLTLKADSALIARNEDLTARADADIRVVGPLTGATVSGTVAITNSQFFKNIDLIPIGTPGRPPPSPKPPSDAPDLSFPNPPLRDWKFDIAIKTKDPFLIRGNLAQGGALVDMKLTGTGLAPKLDGSVRLQNVEATLPFSRLEIQQGFLYFNPNDPMNPGIDLQGTSLVKDYTIRVYVYGTANQPEAVFTSEPPLPQEEIISLLATGTTKEELLSGGNALATRAVMLLGQQLYRKIFKKGQSTKPNPVFDNLQVDVGNTDPRTGQQTATARYRVNEKVQLIGQIGVQGDFNGTVKYLIRFR